MHPELSATITQFQVAIISLLEDMAIHNYGNVNMKLRQLYTQLAVQASTLNTNLDQIDPNNPVVINCIPTDEELAAEIDLGGGCE